MKHMIYAALVSELDEDLRTEAFEDGGDLDGKEHTLNVLSWSFALPYLDH